MMTEKKNSHLKVFDLLILFRHILIYFQADILCLGTYHTKSDFQSNSQPARSLYEYHNYEQYMFLRHLHWVQENPSTLFREYNKVQGTFNSYVFLLLSFLLNLLTFYFRSTFIFLIVSRIYICDQQPFKYISFNNLHFEPMRLSFEGCRMYNNYAYHI